VNREIHAGICEGRGVKIPPATRPTGALAEDRGLERCGKRRDMIASGVDRKDERWAEALCRLKRRKQFS
jgi:hypothetical protein